jgi:hypothetical protein
MWPSGQTLVAQYPWSAKARGQDNKPAKNPQDPASLFLTKPSGGGRRRRSTSASVAASVAGRPLHLAFAVVVSRHPQTAAAVVTDRRPQTAAAAIACRRPNMDATAAVPPQPLPRPILLQGHCGSDENELSFSTTDDEVRSPPTMASWFGWLIDGLWIVTFVSERKNKEMR